MKAPQDRRRTGAITVALVAAAALLPIFITPTVFSGNPYLIVFQIGLVLPLLWWRRSPVAVFAAVYAMVFVQYLVTPLNVPGDAALLVALYLVAVNRDLRTVSAAGGIASVLVLLDGLRAIPHHASGWAVVEAAVGMAGLVVAAAAIGAYVRSRRAYLEAVADRAARSERERIAREMHDVVTHSLSVMVTLADGAKAAAGPGKAADAMGMVATTGRQALVDMRRFLEVLRDDEPDAARHPQPGIAQLEELVGTVRAAGLPVRLAFDGDAAGLPTAVQLTVYRVVQESLTNTLKHAGGGDAHVRVSAGEDYVDVEVCDAGGLSASTPVNGGRGVEGMRERVAAYGGRFDAGPWAGGGWRVRARLPLGNEAMAFVAREAWT
ncbi:signal transduction histidine kinase [Catenulispora sp. EB89]|uniref:sensor histidine kinase n=1 Tax=Catenulispora sp. EB89 TaxID=3156257 RepID=UPI0035133718